MTVKTFLLEMIAHSEGILLPVEVQATAVVGTPSTVFFFHPALQTFCKVAVPFLMMVLQRSLFLVVSCLVKSMLHL